MCAFSSSFTNESITFEILVRVFVCVYHVWYVLIFSCACGLIRIYELSVLTATALLLVTTNVIGKQQAIDPSSILPHFFD